VTLGDGPHLERAFGQREKLVGRLKIDDAVRVKRVKTTTARTLAKRGAAMTAPVLQDARREASGAHHCRQQP
jgi:hypothetical protein